MNNNLVHLSEKYLEHILVFRGYSPNTARGYKHSLMACIKFLDPLKEITADQINKSRLEEWILNGKIKRNWSPKNIKNHMKAWISFLDWGVAENIFEKNYMRELPIPKQPKRIPKHLSKDEALKILDWAKCYKYEYTFEKHRAVAILATFIYTGIRRLELMNLKLCDIDLDNRIMSIQQGKGGKDRVVPLSLTLIVYLKRYLKDRARLKKQSIYFFTTLRGNDKMGDLVIRRLVKKLQDKSGIKFYPHLLRHTFATLMLEGGCDIFSLSKMMGHSDIKTTTIYLSASTKHLKEQIIKHPLNF